LRKEVNSVICSFRVVLNNMLEIVSLIDIWSLYRKNY